jgi:antitoxin (DNA-binding transcriptional repressor) of toxin-antitoxin stability system
LNPSIICWATWPESLVTRFVSLRDAETQVSALVDRAATGEEIVMAKNGASVHGRCPSDNGVSGASPPMPRGSNTSPPTSMHPISPQPTVRMFGDGNAE